MGKSKTSFKAGNLAAEKWTEEIALDLANDLIAVSYTHLTLPTKRIV